MKKTLTLTALLTSTLLGAHDPNYTSFFNHHPIFNDGFWQEFDHQFQHFDRQMEKLQRNAHAIRTTSSQYFDKDTNNYVVEIQTSGINKDNFDISTHENRLIIKAKQSLTSNNKISSNYFSQVVSIPMDGDIENIKAEFKNSILVISIPKLNRPRVQIKKIFFDYGI